MKKQTGFSDQFIERFKNTEDKKIIIILSLIGLALISGFFTYQMSLYRQNKNLNNFSEQTYIEKDFIYSTEIPETLDQ